MTEPCPGCGRPVVSHYRPGVDRYADTLGGHTDRHALVMEAATRALMGGDS